LCNVGDEQAPSLLAIDARTWEITPVAGTAGRNGATGLCAIGGEILVAFQSAEPVVAVLDARTLRVRSESVLPGALDVHSIAGWGEGLAVASSGTDEVLWYRYRDGRFSDRTVLWAATPAGKDTVHVNGLAADGERLVCCAFGPRRSERDLWSGSERGYVYDIVRGRVLVAGLRHPHSVTFFGDELLLCESARRSFRSAARRIVELDGYTRGVARLSETSALIGTSRGRVRSRSTDRLLNPSDRGTDAGECALHAVDLDGAVVRTLPLGAYGREVYDVLPLS
jgi:hypothetical protein